LRSGNHEPQPVRIFCLISISCRVLQVRILGPGNHQTQIAWPDRRLAPPQVVTAPPAAACSNRLPRPASLAPASSATFQFPSACLRQMVIYRPVVVTGFPSHPCCGPRMAPGVAHVARRPHLAVGRVHVSDRLSDPSWLIFESPHVHQRCGSIAQRHAVLGKPLGKGRSAACEYVLGKSAPPGRRALSCRGSSLYQSADWVRSAPWNQETLTAPEPTAEANPKPRPRQHRRTNKALQLPAIFRPSRDT